MSVKQMYANHCFGLPVEQVKYFDELTVEQQEEAAYNFGRPDRDRFVYAVKRDGGLVLRRERLRPEWGERR